MSDYTPTTEQVRAAWTSFRDASARQSSEKWIEPFEQFDRWLAEVKAAAWDECLEALAWAMDNGHPGDAIHYVATNNPHRTP